MPGPASEFTATHTSTTRSGLPMNRHESDGPGERIGGPPAAARDVVFADPLREWPERAPALRELPSRSLMWWCGGQRTLRLTFSVDRFSHGGH